MMWQNNMLRRYAPLGVADGNESKNPYLSIIEKHIVVRKDCVLDRQSILNSVSNNDRTICWLSKVHVVLSRKDTFSEQTVVEASIHDAKAHL